MKMGTSARSWAAVLALCGALISNHAWADEAKGTRLAYLSGERAVCAHSIRGQELERTELFFGMNRPDGEVVSSEDFQRFIDAQKVRLELEDGTAHEFKAGEAFAEVVDSWHRGVNVGPGPLKILVFYASADGAPISIPRPPLNGAGPANQDHGG